MHLRKQNHLLSAHLCFWLLDASASTEEESEFSLFILICMRLRVSSSESYPVAVITSLIGLNH